MTSGKFTSYPISKIIVGEDRQRTELKDIPELAASMAKIGQINPILINREDILVAGERRLRAASHLGWTHIIVQFAEDLEPSELYLIELEENIKRSDLEWVDHVMAVRRYHEMKAGEEKDWTQEKTAAALGYNRQSISDYLLVSTYYLEGEPLVVNADKYSVARNVAKRKKERADAEFDQQFEKRLSKPVDNTGETRTGKTSAEVLDALEKPAPTKEAPPIPPSNDILHRVDFAEWTKTYQGKPFNLIHCDFPYGVNADKHAQGAADKYGGYEDGFEVYASLIDTLATYRESIIAPSAHVMFWFSMDYYDYTLTRLREDVKLVVNPFPLVWFKIDNSGILPDPNRGPRRNYETAFLCSTGDRKIVQAVSNVAAIGNTKTIHMSEKPVPMLKHFFRMLVDENTRLFDPTAGSANALKAAKEMGAAVVMGLERDENYYVEAVRNLED